MAAFTMSDAELASEAEVVCSTDNEVRVTDLPDKPLVESKEEKKEKAIGEDEQDLVKKVQELSVAPPVDDSVDFGHDALEATSSAKAELAPDPLKKSSTLPEKENPTLPSLPAPSVELEASTDPSLPVSFQGDFAYLSSQTQASSLQHS